MSSFTYRSDQWDIRINIESDEWFDRFLLWLPEYCSDGAVRYMHVSGIEIGENSDYSSYKKKHVHIALILHNYTSKRSVFNKLIPATVGFYLEPRDKTKDLEGWLLYHMKAATKIQPEIPLLFEFGKFPTYKPKRTASEMSQSDEKKKKRKYADWERKKCLMRQNEWDQLDMEYPGFIYSSMGQSMKREIMKQANDDFTRTLEGKLNNYIIWGPSGSGKSSSVALLYPDCYKKQKGSQYWDAYDKTEPGHSVVWIDEMSKETLKCMTGKQDGGFEFLKELGDRYAVTVDEKYTKGYKIRPKSVIITMNEHPSTLLPDRAVEVNKKALFRKFNIIYVEVS